MDRNGRGRPERGGVSLSCLQFPHLLNGGEKSRVTSMKLEHTFGTVSARHIARICPDGAFSWRLFLLFVTGNCFYYKV